MGLFDFFKKDKTELTDEQGFVPDPYYPPKRIVELLHESADIVNKTSNVKTALSRYDFMLEKYMCLLEFSEDYLIASGINSSYEKIRSDIDSLYRKKETFINQVIDRSFQKKVKDINQLKKHTTKNDHLFSHLEELLSIDGLSEYNRRHIKEEYEKLYCKLNHLQITVTYDPEEDLIIRRAKPDNFYERWSSISKKIATTSNPLEKLMYCEESLEMADEFIKTCISNEGEILYMPCRDLAPKICMRLGDWDKALHFIKGCISANAYPPGKDHDELLYLEKYKQIAQAALDYIKENPGCLQKNMYKILEVNKEDKIILMDFLKYSYILEKKPSGNTNQLYYKPYSSN